MKGKEGLARLAIARVQRSQGSQGLEIRLRRQANTQRTGKVSHLLGSDRKALIEPAPDLIGPIARLAPIDKEGLQLVFRQVQKLDRVHGSIPARFITTTPSHG